MVKKCTQSKLFPHVHSLTNRTHVSTICIVFMSEWMVNHLLLAKHNKDRKMRQTLYKIYATREFRTHCVTRCLPMLCTWQPSIKKRIITVKLSVRCVLVHYHWLATTTGVIHSVLITWVKRQRGYQWNPNWLHALRHLISELCYMENVIKCTILLYRN